MANIRGGGEYGPAWHQAALRENRQRATRTSPRWPRTWSTRGSRTPAQLGIQGGSNGGLLMGVMLTRYPELFGAVVCQVPLLDMRRYHKLLAGASWMAEYGDPDDAGRLGVPARVLAVPQRATPGRPYPPVLFTTSTRDDRVHPGHARKMVARHARAWATTCCYYENIEGGHGARRRQRAGGADDGAGVRVPVEPARRPGAAAVKRLPGDCEARDCEHRAVLAPFSGRSAATGRLPRRRSARPAAAARAR